MLFWSCIIPALLCWLVIGALVVAALYAAHWVVAIIAVLAALVLLRPERNVGGRRG